MDPRFEEALQARTFLRYKGHLTLWLSWEFLAVEGGPQTSYLGNARQKMSAIEQGSVHGSCGYCSDCLRGPTYKERILMLSAVGNDAREL